jgi:hypothetical protein
MRYKLYQIKDVENCLYLFSSFNFAQQKGFSIHDYEVVYEGAIGDYNVEYTLEKLFDMFNIYRPEDFKGRSMSVSDVVMLDRGTYVEYYYCDHIGFKLIPISLVGSCS